MARYLLAALVLMFASPVAAQTISGCGTLAITKADAGSIPKLTQSADCFGRAKALATNAEQARRDRIVAITPKPSPMPMPMPTPTTAVPTPSLAGLAPVPSGITDFAPLLEPAWGTGALPGPDSEGAFRFMCAPSHNAYDDPIVYPGQPGKSHLHTFAGNTKADANSTYASLRATGESSCNNLLNRSAYWIAAMMHPSGKVVMPDYFVIYYKRPALAQAGCALNTCLGLPRGLRYVFGYNMLDPTRNDPSVLRWFNCGRPSGNVNGVVEGHFATIREAAKGCPASAYLGAVIVGPQCWNGKDLDSPDHRSHMAFADGNSKCPSTHPYLLPFFEMGAWYRSDGNAGAWKLSSDIAMGTEGGVTFHADWWGAWEDSILAKWMANCIDKQRSCSGGDLGDGTMLKNTATYYWDGATAPTRLVDTPSRPNF